ncbi:hypothetical protein ABS735_00830 [Streptomyces sp. MMCC 100]|uniref:hypothetical protein n=1 Tax=Streptomyces sp. MMCC 100 TaxID=3163555 RepID=UPI00359BA8A6
MTRVSHRGAVAGGAVPSRVAEERRGPRRPARCRSRSVPTSTAATTAGPADTHSATSVPAPGPHRRRDRDRHGDAGARAGAAERLLRARAHCGALVTVAVVPLAAALYVVTSTTWSAVERAVLYR